VNPGRRADGTQLPVDGTLGIDAAKCVESEEGLDGGLRAIGNPSKANQVAVEACKRGITSSRKAGRRDAGCGSEPDDSGRSVDQHAIEHGEHASPEGHRAVQTFTPAKHHFGGEPAVERLGCRLPVVRRTSDHEVSRVPLVDETKRQRVEPFVEAADGPRVVSPSAPPDDHRARTRSEGEEATSRGRCEIVHPNLRKQLPLAEDD